MRGHLRCFQLRANPGLALGIPLDFLVLVDGKKLELASHGPHDEARRIVMRWKKDNLNGGYIRRANLSIEELARIAGYTLSIDPHSMNQVLENHIEKRTIYGMDHYYFDYSRIVLCEDVMNPPLDIRTALSSCGFFDPVQNTHFYTIMDLYCLASEDTKDSKETMLIVPHNHNINENHKAHVFFGLTPRVLHVETPSAIYAQLQMDYSQDVYRQDKYEKEVANSAEKMRKMYSN